MSSAPRFELDALYAIARTQFGVRELAAYPFEAALRELLGALDEQAGIAPLRRSTVLVELAHHLATWARVSAALAAHPQLAQQPIERPIFIVGLPRTGTTLLHNLMAGHPELRAPRLWELRAPVRPAGAPERAELRAKQETRALLERLHAAAPRLPVIHPVSVEGPDECSWLFRATFATLYFAFRHPIIGYARWLMATDMTPYYRAYRLMLQAMAWQRPGPGRWVLKDPCHLWHLDALTEVFPDATLVFLHRPMAEVLPSMASLLHTLHSLDGVERDPLTLGAYTTELADRGVFGAMSLRPFLGQTPCVDLDFRALVADPGACVTRIAERAGCAADPSALASMLRWVQQNPRAKQGAHRYSLDAFGLAQRAIRARFARYEARYLDA